MPLKGSKAFMVAPGIVRGEVHSNILPSSFLPSLKLLFEVWTPGFFFPEALGCLLLLVSCLRSTDVCPLQHWLRDAKQLWILL